MVTKLFRLFLPFDLFKRFFVHLPHRYYNFLNCMLFLGVGGNLVAVQASRLSTALHQASRPGVLPEDAVHGCPNLCSTYFGKSTITLL